MSSNKKDGSSESLQVIYPECGYCKRTIVKSSAKCSICNKVYHPSCANKAKKCCNEDLTTSSDFSTGDISPMSENVNKKLSIESTHQELLLKIIFELESKNAVLTENNSLLKFKISSLEVELNNKQMMINNLSTKKDLNTNMRVDKTYKHVQIDVTEDAPLNYINLMDTATAVPNRLSTPTDIRINAADAPTSGALNKPSVSTAENDSPRNNGNREIKSKASNTENMNSNAEFGNQVDETRWTTVTNKKKNHLTLSNQHQDKNETTKKSSKNKTKRSTLCTGTINTNTNIKGAIRRKWIYVGRIAGDVSEVDVQNFLSNLHGNQMIEVKKLPTKGPNSSFSIGVPSEDLYIKLNDPNFWPAGITIREFNFLGLFRKPPKQQN